MTPDLFELDAYRIRRKVLKLFGASFHVYDTGGNVVAFSSQKAFRLREDIRVYADESRSEELLVIKARQIVDFSAAYDVLDPREGRKVGAARRKGFSSILRDSWELLGEDDRPIAYIREDSRGMALLRRLLTNLVPQSFHVRSEDGREHAILKQRFNPFVYKLDVTVRPECTLDRRLLFAAIVLIAAVEGRQG